MAEAITTIQTQKNSINHRVLYSPPIILKQKLELVGDFQVTPRLCLPLYAILLDYNIIHGRYAPEAQLSTCLDSLPW